MGPPVVARAERPGSVFTWATRPGRPDGAVGSHEVLTLKAAAKREEWRKVLTEKDPGDPGYVAPGDHEAALEAIGGAAGMQPDYLGSDWLDDWDPEHP